MRCSTVFRSSGAPLYGTATIGNGYLFLRLQSLSGEYRRCTYKIYQKITDSFSPQYNAPPKIFVSRFQILSMFYNPERFRNLNLSVGLQIFFL